MAKQKKQKQPPELYWNDLVSLYFAFCTEKFNDVPSFDNSQPRDLKNIITALRKRAEDKQIEWTHEVATTRLWHFLEFAYQSSEWLRNNWLPSNLNRQKDAIFFNFKKQQK